MKHLLYSCRCHFHAICHYLPFPLSFSLSLFLLTSFTLDYLFCFPTIPSPSLTSSRPSVTAPTIFLFPCFVIVPSTCLLSFSSSVLLCCRHLNNPSPSSLTLHPLPVPPLAISYVSLPPPHYFPLFPHQYHHFILSFNSSPTYTS